jgi:hypothetical protein
MGEDLGAVLTIEPQFLSRPSRSLLQSGKLIRDPVYSSEGSAYVAYNVLIQRLR